MAAIRNSFFGKGLKILLIGYFLLCSLNLASSFDRVILDGHSDVLKQSGFVCKMAKLFFDCEESSEEYEFEKQQTKNAKEPLVLFEYLIGDPGWKVPAKSLASDKACLDQSNHDLKGGLFARIHLPPPERFL